MYQSIGNFRAGSTSAKESEDLSRSSCREDMAENTPFVRKAAR